jgi:hypothetical protein
VSEPRPNRPDGFADVWAKGHFASEYKGKRQGLKAAYCQLVDYKVSQDVPSERELR